MTSEMPAAGALGSNAGFGCHYEWPECFISGSLEPDLPDLAICAVGLSAWGICMAGERPVPLFGIVMAEIGERLKISPTPDGLMAYSKTHRQSNV